MSRRPAAVSAIIPIPATTPSIPPPFRSRHALSTPEAALYSGTKPFFVEEASRLGDLPFREPTLSDGTVSGAGRLYSTEDLDAWIATWPKLRITEIVRRVVKTEAA